MLDSAPPLAVAVPSRLPALVTQAVLPRDARLPTCLAKAGRPDETPQAWWCGSPTFILFAMWRQRQQCTWRPPTPGQVQIHCAHMYISPFTTALPYPLLPHVGKPPPSVSTRTWLVYDESRLKDSRLE